MLGGTRGLDWSGRSTGANSLFCGFLLEGPSPPPGGGAPYSEGSVPGKDWQEISVLRNTRGQLPPEGEQNLSLDSRRPLDLLSEWAGMESTDFEVGHTWTAISVSTIAFTL